jgi:capsular polysaccharide biosynthesis protein
METPGRLGVLASRGDSNYYHFLIDVLPRLGVLEQARDVAPPDRWYAPAQARFQRELLELAGITADVRIDSDEHPHVRAECLVVPGLASVVKEKNPPWMVAFLRERLMKDVSPPTKLRPLYVARTAGSHNRTVVNEAALIRLLEVRGFGVIDPAAVSVTAQIEAFASASVIVSAHGAALANLVFASPGATVIELFPAGSVLPDYWRLASSAGVHYRYLSAWPSNGKRNRSTTIVSDIEVDLAALESMLDACLP